MDVPPTLESVKNEENESPPKIVPSLPPKPLSALEETRKKGFYPISWRVIGGGVMMGGKSSYLCLNLRVLPKDLSMPL
jgi:hypothetical protein